MLRDLDSLLHEVRDERTRPLVSEAVKAYGAGAMRAATVSLWIAVVADLIFKIRFLAESDDGEASKAIKELDRAIERRRSERSRSSSGGCCGWRESSWNC